MGDCIACETWWQMGVSENSVPLNPMVLLIIIPIKWLFHWEYTLFSDKPKWLKMRDEHAHENTKRDLYTFRWGLYFRPGWHILTLCTTCSYTCLGNNRPLSTMFMIWGSIMDFEIFWDKHRHGQKTVGFPNLMAIFFCFIVQSHEIRSCCYPLHVVAWRIPDIAIAGPGRIAPFPCEGEG